MTYRIRFLRVAVDFFFIRDPVVSWSLRVGNPWILAVAGIGAVSVTFGPHMSERRALGIIPSSEAE